MLNTAPSCLSADKEVTYGGCSAWLFDGLRKAWRLPFQLGPQVTTWWHLYGAIAPERRPK
jgi:hypothetical protein